MNPLVALFTQISASGVTPDVANGVSASLTTPSTLTFDSLTPESIQSFLKLVKGDGSVLTPQVQTEIQNLLPKGTTLPSTLDEFASLLQSETALAATQAAEQLATAKTDTAIVTPDVLSTAPAPENIPSVNVQPPAILPDTADIQIGDNNLKITPDLANTVNNVTNGGTTLGQPVATDTAVVDESLDSVLARIPNNPVSTNNTTATNNATATTTALPTDTSLPAGGYSAQVINPTDNNVRVASVPTGQPDTLTQPAQPVVTASQAAQVPLGTAAEEYADSRAGQNAQASTGQNVANTIAIVASATPAAQQTAAQTSAITITQPTAAQNSAKTDVTNITAQANSVSVQEGTKEAAVQLGGNNTNTSQDQQNSNNNRLATNQITPQGQQVDNSFQNYAQTQSTLHEAQNIHAAKASDASSAAYNSKGLPSPTEQVSVSINNALKQGDSQITIKLQPAELGRVDVRLDVHMGKVDVMVMVDKQETLDMLRQDSRSLERALQDAGLKTDSNSLSFDLRGGNGGNPLKNGQGNQAYNLAQNAVNDNQEAEQLNQSANQDIYLGDKLLNITI